MRENKFQSLVIKELHDLLPGCIVMKNDANYIQGFPDLTIFYEDTWFALECKRSANEPFQPNQEYYIDLLNHMSFARVIFPENKEEIYDDIQYLLDLRR